MRVDPTMSLIRSRQRVADHGEVFTPAWLVEDMLDLVGEDAARIDARVLEAACGAGNFLVAAFARKLATVQATHGGNDFARRHYALFALMCLYGIELLADNAAECRENLAEVYDLFLGGAQDDVWARAARAVLAMNIVQGDALTMTTPDHRPITFAEWGYLGKGKYQRRDFRYDALTRRSELEVDGSLFADLGHELFTPAATFPTITVTDLAGQVSAA